MIIGMPCDLAIVAGQDRLEAGGDAPIRLVHSAGEVLVHDLGVAGEEVFEHPAYLCLAGMPGEGSLDAEQGFIMEARERRIHVLGIDIGEVFLRRQVNQLCARKGGCVLHQASPSLSRLSPLM